MGSWAPFIRWGHCLFEPPPHLDPRGLNHNFSPQGSKKQATHGAGSILWTLPDASYSPCPRISRFTGWETHAHEIRAPWICFYYSGLVWKGVCTWDRKPKGSLAVREARLTEEGSGWRMWTHCRHLAERPVLAMMWSDVVEPSCLLHWEGLQLAHTISECCVWTGSKQPACCGSPLPQSHWSWVAAEHNIQSNWWEKWQRKT